MKGDRPTTAPQVPQPSQAIPLQPVVNQGGGQGKGRSDQDLAAETAQPTAAPSTRRGSNNPNPNRASRTGGWQDRSQWPARRNNQGQGRNREQEDRIKELLVQVTRLTLRLEDQMMVANLDNEFILFFQTRSSHNPWSITDSLYAVGQDWRDKKAHNPQSLTQPLRNVMLYCVLNSMLQMMTRLEDAAQVDTIQRAKELNLVQGTAYVYLTWNAETKTHEPAQADLLEHTEAVSMIRTMLTYTAFPDVVGRFHPVRPLTENLSSEVIPFVLVLQNRSPESQEMYRMMRRFCRSAVTHLVAMTLRPTKLGRSQLAQQVDRLAQNL